MHTDPELKPNHILYWNLKDWRNEYLESILDFTYYIHKSPFAIEFHPGITKRSKGFFQKFIIDAIENFKGVRNDAPYILVEIERACMYPQYLI